MLSGTRALARSFRSYFGSHWNRCLDSTEDFLRTQEASYTTPFLVHSFDNALSKFNQLAREDYRKVDSSYPEDIRTPANVVALFKAVFKKMESAVNHGAYDRFNANITVHPGARKSAGFSATPLKRLAPILESFELPPSDSSARLVHQQVISRVNYLCEIGLGYLTLDRPTRSLSGGEIQRVNLTTCLKGHQSTNRESS